MPAITGSLKKAAAKSKRRAPVWTGPCGEGPQGGVTQGLIGRYLCCKERFRLLVVDDLKGRDKFSAPIEFGNIWHACEEEHAKGGDPSLERWKARLDGYCAGLGQRYPFDRSEIDLWQHKATILFPIYVKHWSKHPDVVDRTPLLQEQVFDVPYRLPSGRTVRLRGKWDSVDLIGKGKEAAIYLQENKTKSELNQQKVARQLRFDLQTMTYAVAFIHQPDNFDRYKFGGVRYNVVRRSAHKEKYVQNELAAAASENPLEWFDRWLVEISPHDLGRFRRTCLDPVLENLCDDFEWWSSCKDVEGSSLPEYRYDQYDWQTRRSRFPQHVARHFRYPFGIYNPLDEGGGTDLDEHLETGSVVGLQRVDDLFPELKQGA